APRSAPFVCEVADSSLRFDRIEKLPLYATAGVSEYLIVNVKAQELEQYLGPTKSGTYRKKHLYRGASPFTSTALPAVTLVPEQLFAKLKR
ncbi:MAG: Uma2 family endonuclease, partial [Myxococcaceae bacterium]|nr:Uma2 family endonuclease [Myxococcaceae bacterium]